MSEYHKEGEVGHKKLSWQVKVFIFALILPPEISFAIGSFRLSPYRVVLLLFFVPCFLRVFSGKVGERLLTDQFLFLYVLWNILALALNHNWSMALETGGILMVESFGAYLFARSFIRTEVEFSKFVQFAILVVI